MRRIDSINFEERPSHREGILERRPHQIRWSASGNPNGVPMIFSHGGPGGQNKSFYRTLFDLEKWYMVQIDQPGNGVSTPAGEISENTTQLSIADMESLREQLGIDRWVVAGGSWGSTLSIAYAETHPARALGLLVFCMWLGRPGDLNFWFDAGQWIFPECYAEVTDGMTAEEIEDPAVTLYERILGGDAALASDAARRLHDYEQIMMHLHPPVVSAPGYDTDVFSRVFAHYMTNDCFLRPNQLIEDAARLQDIPTTIVQGRFDMCTPPKIAFEFKAAAPHADLRIVDNASHMPTERNFLREIVRAGEDLHHVLQPV